MAESDPRPPLTPPASPEPVRSVRSARRAALGALAAEVGHELQGPLNLFRLTHERLARGSALDDEDLALLDEELARLSRLSARLRTLAQNRLELGAASPRELVEAALSAPPALGAESLELDVEPASSVTLGCDLELLAGAVRELIDNALEARERRAGVRFEAGPQPGLCVWDDGAGIELELAQAMTWGVTTRPLAAGIGLTLALRAARAHGFTLELRRSADLTEAWLLFPASALRDAGIGGEP
jgi:signal transduction histidine kinase